MNSYRERVPVDGGRVSGKRAIVTLVGRWAVLAAVVPLFLVAGCGGDEPKPKMAATTSAAPTPTPTPTATPSPAAWEVKTNAGAVAFAKHWIAVFNQATSAREIRGA